MTISIDSNRVRNPEVKALFDAIANYLNDLSLGADDIDEGTITNALLATDVKVGSLASLDTTEKASLVGAINELVTSLSGKPTLDVGSNDVLRSGKVQLRGTQTPILFGASIPATLTGSADGSSGFDISGGDGSSTLLIDVNGAGDVTVTFSYTAGYDTGSTGCSEDMTSAVDNKLTISVDGDDAEEVTFDWSGCNSGALIAAQMQSAIQALGGSKAGVTVAFSTDHYVITSGTKGSGSAVTITRSAANNCTEELKIGPDGEGATAGTGNVVDASAVTLAECKTIIEAAIETLTVSDDGTYLTLTTTGTGYDQSINVNASSDLEETLGLSTTITYGTQGLGYASDMADTDYIVTATIDGTAGASLGSKNIAIADKATDGFNIECEDNSADDYVDLMILGIAA